MMASSYLLLDKYLQFLNKGVKDPMKSILKIGVEEVIKDVYWDEQAFNERGSVYQWSKRGHDAYSELNF